MQIHQPRSAHVQLVRRAKHVQFTAHLAHKKRYPVFNGDPGYCHPLAATALGLRDSRCAADISLYVSGDQQEPLCFQVNRPVPQSAAVGRGLV